MIKLSKRLAALKSLWDEHPVVLDLACDHGKLGLSFINENRVEQVELIDISDNVISKLCSYIPKSSKFIIKKEDIRKIKISNNKRKIIYISGIGTTIMNQTLSQLAEQINSEDDVAVVLHDDILVSRQFLSQSIYRLKSEQLIFENKHFYQVLSLSKNSHYPIISPYGDNIWQQESAPIYRDRLLSFLRPHRSEESIAYRDFLNSKKFL